MLAPFAYILALIAYIAVGGSFCAGCLLLALFPRVRTRALRAALSMVATYPGVLLYQIASLPLVAISFALPIIAGLLGQDKHAGWFVAALSVPVFVFAGASVAGFVSGWRVGWTAASERSFSAGLRRDLLVTLFRRVRRGLRNKSEATVRSEGPRANCKVCGSTFNVQDMIPYENHYICSQCKPVFLQKLAEGAISEPRADT